MRWKKTKLGFVVGVVVLLAMGGVIGVVYHNLHSPPVQTGRPKLPTGNVTPKIGYGTGYGIILASDGSLWSWGENAMGWPVLGLETSHHTVSLRRIGNQTEWESLSVGGDHSLATKSDGTLWAWGANYSSQLGDGTKIQRSKPMPSAPGKEWKQAAAGGAHSLALKTDGTLWAWGDNWTGQLGTGNTKASTNALQVGASTHWVKIWAGGIQSVGLQSNGTLWHWGRGARDTDQILIPTLVSPDTNWVDVCFGYFTIFAIKTDGTLWSWGRKAEVYTKATAPASNTAPVQVGTDSDWQACASMPGGFYQILKKTDGSLWALDASDYRRGKRDSKHKPAAFSKIALDKDVVAFTGGGDNVGVVLTRDGEVWTWGRVIGEYSEHNWGPKGDRFYPQLRVVDKPWQLFNID